MDTLLIPLKSSGLPHITKPDIESLLVDLLDKGWVHAVENHAASEIKRYRRTDTARAWLRVNGF